MTTFPGVPRKIKLLKAQRANLVIAPNAIKDIKLKWHYISGEGEAKIFEAIQRNV